jgi:aryl hydrocarbon receptor nuclear translocator
MLLIEIARCGFYFLIFLLKMCVIANMRLCMGSRRGFIIRMRLGDTPVDPLATSSHTVRVRHRSTLGPSGDGRQYAVVHVTGYIRNWLVI